MVSARTSLSHPAFATSVLREFALLADGERGALLSPHGEIVWMCAPSFHSPSIFGELLGGRGTFAVHPTDRHVWGGYYEPGSLIFHSRWVTEDGIVECREALAFPGDPHRAVLIRQIRALSGRARLRIRLDPWPGYGRQRLPLQRSRPGLLTGDSAGLHVRLSGLTGTRRSGPADQDGWEFTLTVEAGEVHDLILEISDRPLPTTLPRPDRIWKATETAWDAALSTGGTLPGGDEARHSLAVLRGLTGSSGGMVAAATTSLPERADTGRNYDYRYVWIRDQSFAGQAAAVAGADDLLDSAVRFSADRLLDHGDRLAPAYTIDGEPVPDQRRLRMPGYPGGFNLVGNHANQQFQLDAFGEALLLFAAAGRAGRLDGVHYRAAGIAVEAIGRRWTEPDAGIWEIDAQAWTHSRLICVAGLRAIAAIAPAGPEAGKQLGLAETILADTTSHAVHPTGRWQRSATDPALDAALLIPPLRGAVPPDDPRTLATLDAYLAELTDAGYAYRFRHDERPLADAEGSFTLCGFHTVMALHQQGRTSEAVGWFERLQAACGPARLFAEEFDVQQHQLRGNLPQAFVHATHLEAAARLSVSPSR